VAVVWFAIGVAVFAITAALALPRLALPDDVGLRVLWGFLEAFVGVGMILGILAFFRRFAKRSGAWLGRLEGNVYGVYLVHIYVVLGLQAAMLGTELPALAKFLIVAATAIILSFVVVSMLRRMRVVRSVV
jgi:surface polysaccharide O-acyltransferase-like enzyme